MCLLFNITTIFYRSLGVTGELDPGAKTNWEIINLLWRWPVQQRFAQRSVRSGRYLFWKHEIYDDVVFQNLFSKHEIDCVIHFAALKAVGESCRLPLMYYGNNVTGSANLMEVMMEKGVKRIVFSSSATVYGDPEYLPVDEKHPTGKCTNPYGKTKYFMEEIIKDVCAANQVCTFLCF